MSALEKTLLGKIFISHSSKDKRFVRKLVSELEARGFSTWLDERELHAGDQLAETIGDAIASAKVVVVVISKASVRSKWLRHELNQATELMIKGKCRLIPVVIGKVEPPPEIGGILYADFRSGFNTGLSKVLSTLEHECERYASEMGFGAKTERLLTEEFGRSGSGSVLFEYKSIDYEIIWMDGTEVVYEIMSAYAHSDNPLSEQWWHQYRETLADIGNTYALLVSERPLGLAEEMYVDGEDKRIARIKTATPVVGVDEVVIVAIDMSGTLPEARQRELLRRAMKVFEESQK